MSTFTSAALAFSMVVAFLLALAGAKLARTRQTRGRGILMMVAALIIITNVTIWTV